MTQQTHQSPLVDAYISQQSIEIQPLLNQIRQALSTTLPEAIETISWKMPTWKERKNIIHFAAHKNHLSIYPGPKAIEHFSPQFDNNSYKYSKGTVQFPYKNSIPIDFICQIALWCQTQQ